MFLFAPNLTHVCGSSTAAKLMGTAGGLVALSRIPACNIMLLGASKKSLAGFSSAAILPHTGHIYYSELVQAHPPDFRRKAAKLVAAKAALAARVDSFHDNDTRSGRIGMELKQDVLHKLEKAMEPPPARAEKALPRPDDYVNKKRAGKRVKRQKERFIVSETRKQANRMNFGEIEEDILQDSVGHSFGQAGKDTGHVRATVSTQKNTSLSKKMQKELNRQKQMHGGLSSIRGPSGGLSIIRGSGGLSTIRNPGSASTVRNPGQSGMASVVFTPFQGFEINQPKAADRVAEANAKYFGPGNFDLVKRRRLETSNGPTSTATTSS